MPLIADNTATPLIARPLEHGAAVVVYSATKYIGGHGTSIGGLIVDGGNFPWEEHAERFPLLTQPDDAYHGAIWTEAAKPLGPIAYVLRARVKLLRDIGAAISPVQRVPDPAGARDAAAAGCASTTRTPIAVANFLKTRPRSLARHLPRPADAANRAAAPTPISRADTAALVGFELNGGVEAGQQASSTR